MATWALPVVAMETGAQATMEEVSAATQTHVQTCCCTPHVSTRRCPRAAKRPRGQVVPLPAVTMETGAWVGKVSDGSYLLHLSACKKSGAEKQ